MDSSPQKFLLEAASFIGVGTVYDIYLEKSVSLSVCMYIFVFPSDKKSWNHYQKILNKIFTIFLLGTKTSSQISLDMFISFCDSFILWQKLESIHSLFFFICFSLLEYVCINFISVTFIENDFRFDKFFEWWMIKQTPLI